MLVNEYRGGRMPIFHFDTYRLKDEDEFYDLGPEEYFESSGVTFVEWADRFPQVMPLDRLEIIFEVIGDTARRITIRRTSPQMEKLVTQIAAGL